MNLPLSQLAVTTPSRLFDDAVLRPVDRRRLMRLAFGYRGFNKRLAEMVSADVALTKRYRLLTPRPGRTRAGELLLPVLTRASSFSEALARFPWQDHRHAPQRGCRSASAVN